MKWNLPGARTSVFGGVATGVVKAQEAAMPMAMSTGNGETPIDWQLPDV